MQLQQLPLNVSIEYKNLMRDLQKKIKSKKIEILKQENEIKKTQDELVI